MAKETTEVPQDLSKVKMCAALSVRPNLMGKAMEAALKERSDNILLPGMMPMGVNSLAVSASNAMPAPAITIVTLKRWKPGRVLKVRFLGNPPAVVKQKIQAFAKKWENIVSVRFSFGNAPDAEIRITCNIGDGSWSYLGTDALAIPKNQATMNYGWFTPSTPDNEYSRTVLHEFGHALGATHEHQHPIAGIPWNRPAVYEYYQSTQGWSKQDVDFQIFAKYDKNLVNSSSYDKTSIMHYAIDKALLLDPAFAVAWNTTISGVDKAFMKQMYP